MSEWTKLDRTFYLGDTESVARDLLGRYLVHEHGGEVLAAEITETEAYTGIRDPACHSFGGRRTSRTEVIYREGGHSYVYLIYGMYHLFNIVTEPAENPCAVLIREAVPVCGHDAIARLRFQKAYDRLSRTENRSLLNGPGKLTRGLGIHKAHNGLDLTAGSLYLTEGRADRNFTTGCGKRINIDYAGEAAHWPLRFFMELHP